jgi:hypothetical protein
MEYALTLLEYVQQHPPVGLVVVLALALVLFRLNRKPRAVRDAEKRFQALQKQGHDHYRQQRPLG